MKVAVVDVVRVLDDTQLGRAGAKEVEALYQKQQRELAPLLQQAKAKRPGDGLFKTIEERQKGFEVEREKLRADLRNQLLARLQPVLQKLASDGGFDFIMARPQAMIFAKQELDLTAAAVTAMDALAPG